MLSGFRYISVISSSRCTSQPNMWIDSVTVSSRKTYYSIIIYELSNDICSTSVRIVFCTVPRSCTSVCATSQSCASCRNAGQKSDVIGRLSTISVKQQGTDPYLASSPRSHVGSAPPWSRDNLLRQLRSIFQPPPPDQASPVTMAEQILDQVRDVFEGQIVGFVTCFFGSRR